MITLADYQLVARNWLVEHRYGILADEPGVGKTHPTIFAAKGLKGPKLVVAPAYLLTNWQAELEASEETDIVALMGSTVVKQQQLLQHHNWTLLSYELFARKDWIALIALACYDLIVFDEAHRMRGRSSLRTKAAYTMRDKARRVWMLTGTPIVTSAGDLFPLLKICDPKSFSSYWRFVGTHCALTKTPWATKVGRLLNPPAFEAVVKPYVLRRKLADVLPEIPEIVENVLSVDISEDTRRRYKRAKTEYLIEHPDGRVTRIEAAGLLTQLRKLTAEPKLEALKGLLEDLPEEEQVVVFAWHRFMVDAVLESIPEAFGFTGETKPELRQRILAAFQAKQYRVICATLATMQEGVNLQNAKHVVFLEEGWTGAINDQGTARLRRRGQAETVIKTVILARKSVDTAVHKVQAARRERALEAVFDEVMSET